MAEQARYDRIGVGYDTTRRADPYITERLVDLLAPMQGGVYLDVACGSGNYTTALAGTGLAMSGVDQSTRMIEADRRKSDAVRWHVGDVSALLFGDRSFDGAVCTLAIHHFKDLTAAMREIRRVLRGGRLVMFSSTRQQMRGYWINAYFPNALAGAIAQMPDLPDVQRSLREAGFRLIVTEAYEVRLDLQDLFLYSGKRRPEIYLDARVRAGISTFSLLADAAEVDAGCRKMAGDIATGRINDVMRSYEHSFGDYLFIAADVDDG